MSIRTEKFLLDLGLAPSLTGFGAAAAAIDILLEDPEKIYHMCGKGGLYEQAGKVIGKTPSRTERAIRYVIETYYNEHAPEPPFDGIAGYYNSKPTNRQFLSTCKIVMLHKNKKSYTQKLGENVATPREADKETKHGCL